jgi:hypothetical protein
LDRKPTAAELLRDLENAGEAAVRRIYERGHYSGQTELVVRKWLAQKKDQRNDDSQSESLETAKSAKDAAWAAASAARDAANRAKTANTIATLALIAAVIAIAFSIVGLFLR